MAPSNSVMKYCSGCRQTLPLDLFGMDKHQPGGRRWRCKTCNNAERRRRYARMTPEEKKEKQRKSTEWRHANPEREKARAKRQYWANKDKLRAQNRFRSIGVTREQYDAAFEAQSGCCAICGKHQSEQKRALPADHCHATGVFRGLLCDNCNHGLGKFKDRPDLLLAAVAYLNRERWRQAIAS